MVSRRGPRLGFGTRGRIAHEPSARSGPKWSFDIRAPPKCRLCSQPERGFSLVSLTGSTWRREDVVLLEPFWDACDAGACQLAWFRSNASNLAAHPVISPGPSFPSA